MVDAAHTKRVDIVVVCMGTHLGRPIVDWTQVCSSWKQAWHQVDNAMVDRKKCRKVKMSPTHWRLIIPAEA